ncbi:MAG: endonuclease Q family protein [Nanoarchaeota archaeon]
MRIMADLQIHSRYARATSKNITIENLEKYAQIKGINILGTGDFQHPLWNKEIKEKLKEDDKGILRTAGGFPFLWQTEVSLMFSQGGKRRAVHLLIFAPNGEIADKITAFLGSKGRLDYDGRPIFGMSCKYLTNELKKIDGQIEIIPAHAFTPWFGMYGSESGFDSIAECFEEEAKHIHAIESGMSADHAMIWRLKERVNIVSFSDAHSFWPFRLGREATIFEIPELSYIEIMKAILTGDGLVGTIETPPEYGKYHYDGHRNCNFSCSPEETKKINGICPVCKKELIIGVENRIDEIAKEKTGFKPDNAKSFYSILPLQELIALAYGMRMESKKGWEIYNLLIAQFGNEFNILLNVSKEELLLKKVNNALVDLILLGREGKLKVKPGFDGEYGVVQMPEKQGRLA